MADARLQYIHERLATLAERTFHVRGKMARKRLFTEVRELNRERRALLGEPKPSQ